MIGGDGYEDGSCGRYCDGNDDDVDADDVDVYGGGGHYDDDDGDDYGCNWSSCDDEGKDSNDDG